MTIFLDTNVLLYAVGAGDNERPKRKRAYELLDRDDVTLSVQVFNEFLWRSTRPHREPGLSEALALRHIAVWRRFRVQELTMHVFDHALAILTRDKLSWWDCLIVAAARAQGCDILYSEDMQDGRIVDGMRIVDPFRD